MNLLFISSSSTVMLIMFQIHENLLEGINSAWTHDHFTVTAKVRADTQHQHQLLCANHCSKELKYLNLFIAKQPQNIGTIIITILKTQKQGTKKIQNQHAVELGLKPRLPIINVSFKLSYNKCLNYLIKFIKGGIHLYQPNISIL